MGIFDVGKRAFDCNRTEENGVEKIVCSPILKHNDMREPLSDEPVVFRIDPNTRVLQLIHEGSADEETMKGLQTHLQRYYSNK